MIIYDWPAGDNIPMWLLIRISAFEYVMQVILANELTLVDEERSSQFKADLIQRPLQLPPKSGPVDVENLKLMQNEFTTVLENFLRKVSSREANLRDLQKREDIGA